MNPLDDEQQDAMLLLIGGAAVQMLDMCRLCTGDDLDRAEQLAWQALRAARRQVEQ